MSSREAEIKAEVQLPTASLGKRLAAMGYDCLVLFGVLFLAGSLYRGTALLFVPATGDPSVNTGDVIHQLQPAASGPFYQIYLLLVIYGFFALFWHSSGQTLGMLAWRLRIQDPEGYSISWNQTLRRFLGAIVSCACLGLGYWWVLFDKDKQSWHDKLSNSSVVQLPKKK
jgi:uncharacterized RDD family membrane protein YckC